MPSIWRYGSGILMILLLVGACADTAPSAPEDAEVSATLELESSAFAEGETIPVRYTCDGDDVSPPLSWDEPPEGTQSLALVADDPDAPVGTWVHWVLFDLPPTSRSLPEGAPAEPAAEGGTHGDNSWNDLGYGGPCPPGGSTHRYFFKLYALDTTLGLEAGASKREVEQAMDGHILAQDQLMGRYGR